MPLLYKYIKDKLDDGRFYPELILSSLQIAVSDPRRFNDPFEVRPWFDQECHDHFAKQHEDFHEKTVGIRHSLLAGESMVGMPTERAINFSHGLTKRFRDELGRELRVLCLSCNPKSVLMWGHYTNCYRGIALGIDTDVRGFQTGLKAEVYPIEYSSDRSKTRLPLAYFSSPHIEMMDCYGNIVNPPDSLVDSYAGLQITFCQYRKELQEAKIAALTTKAQDWHYEQEIRFIYDVSGKSKLLSSTGMPMTCPTTLEQNDGRHFAKIPPEALKEIIVGHAASSTLVQRIVALLRAGKIGKPKLFYTSCHPFLYEVDTHETNVEYLLDYFSIVTPTL
jgi:hypothetical protein